MSSRVRLSGLSYRPEPSSGAGEIQHVRWRIADAATEFASPKVRRLFEWWAAAGDGGMPRRQPFDPTPLAGIIRNLFLVRVLPDGGFRFQLQGEGVTDLLGVNDAGRIVGRDDPRVYDRELADYYRRIVGDRRCRVCTGHLGALGREFIRIESIDCPLSDDGVTVSAILGAIDAIRPAR